MPGAIHVEISGEFGSELRQNLLPGECVHEVVIVQILQHLVGDNDGIFRPPWFWPVFEDAKFDGQPVMVRCDVGVYSFGVRFEERSVPGACQTEGLLRRSAKTKDPLLPIDFEQVFT